MWSFPYIEENKTYQIHHLCALVSRFLYIDGIYATRIMTQMTILALSSWCVTLKELTPHPLATAYILIQQPHGIPTKDAGRKNNPGSRTCRTTYGFSQFLVKFKSGTPEIQVNHKQKRKAMCTSSLRHFSRKKVWASIERTPPPNFLQQTRLKINNMFTFTIHNKCILPEIILQMKTEKMNFWPPMSNTIQQI